VFEVIVGKKSSPIILIPVAPVIHEASREVLYSHLKVSGEPVASIVTL